VLLPSLQEAPSQYCQALVFHLSLALAPVGLIACLGQVAPFSFEFFLMLIALFAEIRPSLTKLTMQLLQLPLLAVEML